MRKPLVIGNWKMHGSTEQNNALLGALLGSNLPFTDVDIAVCPPCVYLQQIAALAQGSALQWGAQNCAATGAGAYTGEVSAAMLRDIGCSYAIIGHSERRSLFAEDETTIAQKFACLVEQQVKPVLCVGETLAQRESERTLAVIAGQLEAVLEANPIALWSGAVVAYEPVWAIGTGKTATPEQAQEVHAFIRQQLARYDADLARSLRVIYGGSVRTVNAAELFGQQDIDGGLIGGAALVAQDFLEICNAASE